MKLKPFVELLTQFFSGYCLASQLFYYLLIILGLIIVQLIACPHMDFMIFLIGLMREHGILWEE